MLQHESFFTFKFSESKKYIYSLWKKLLTQYYRYIEFLNVWFCGSLPTNLTSLKKFPKAYSFWVILKTSSKAVFHW